jgi:outer membrane receptor protein involved in Fe transport
VELIGTDAGKCVYRPQNATEASLRGLELELRRGLTFLPGRWNQLSAGVNLSFVNSKATIPSINGADSALQIIRTLRLQGQSDRLANLNLLYATANGRLEVSVLGNYFSDRLARYGDVVVQAGKPVVLPDTYERSRITLDAKIRRKIGRADLSFSARNLTDNERIFVQDGPKGQTVVGYLRPGIGFSLGIGYALR